MTPQTKVQKFNPPANLQEFSNIPHQLDAWNDIISTFFDETVIDVEKKVGTGKSQYYNPTKVDTTADAQNAEISWIGFPLRLTSKYPNQEQAWQVAEELVTWNGSSYDNAGDPGSYLRTWGVKEVQYRQQDEYLEWHVDRDENGKVIRVMFTCEGPEYWAALAQGYPNTFLYDGPRDPGAKGDRNLLLQLYREYISPEVQMEDLFLNGEYFPYNKWNTTQGAIHLTHPANTLSAEINIAGEATVLRKDNNGNPITDAFDLICCALYGDPGRASDPVIGSDVNALAHKGASITLKDPVALYLKGLDTSGFESPDGSDPQDYWTIQRGNEDQILRAVYEVPKEKGFTVGDITIGGENIQYGGQIANFIKVKLTGVACRFDQSHDEAIPCEKGSRPGCGASPAFKASLMAANDLNTTVDETQDPMAELSSLPKRR